jgi:hypothetical protein
MTAVQDVGGDDRRDARAAVGLPAPEGDTEDVGGPRRERDVQDGAAAAGGGGPHGPREEPQGAPEPSIPVSLSLFSPSPLALTLHLSPRCARTLPPERAAVPTIRKPIPLTHIVVPVCQGKNLVPDLVSAPAMAKEAGIEATISQVPEPFLCPLPRPRC